MAQLTATISVACNAQQKGVVTFTDISDPNVQGGDTYSFYINLAGNPVVGGSLTPGQDLSYALPQDGDYSFQVGNDLTGERSELVYITVACQASSGGGTLPAFQLDSLTHTDESATGAEDGTATIQASGGTAPLTAELPDLSLTEPATAGSPSVFTGLPVGGPYRVQVRDADARVVGGYVTIAPYAAPVTGCQDEYADNYDPDATNGGTSSCTYSPRWRSAWGPTGLAVPVAAVAGQVKAYVAANLYVGFRAGHPLAAIRPLGTAIPLRATVGPDGFAVFRLGPYLRPLLGAADGLGGYRLDLNSLTAVTDDLYVGYELRRTHDDTLLEHGYALNSAVPDSLLVDKLRLTPFTVLPLWPGFDDYRVPFLSAYNLGQYGELLNEAALYLGPTTLLPCPPNALEVAWLAPSGGYGYWVFQGKTQLGDTVEDGQSYQEAGTFERRYSERGAARRTYQARSGVFKGDGLAEGLATLWRSPQVWLKPTPDSEWVPVTISSGDFPVRKLGVLRNEVSVTFTEAAAQYAQGQ